MVKFEETKKKLLKNPNVVKEYESLKPEFTIARALIEARVKAHMTQAEVAIKMHTSQSQVARLESGDHMPSFKSIHKYSQAIDRSIKFEISAN